MGTDWTAFGEARAQAHWAAQWLARAARANLPPAPDDSHSSLAWDEARYAVLSQPLPGGVRIGLNISAFELFVAGTDERFALRGAADADAGAWLDALLVKRGLKRANAATLPYEVERVSYLNVDSAEMARLSRWFSAAAVALEALRGRLYAVHPGPGPVRLWPHHFDIATLVALEEGDAEFARSIGVGLSPGDVHYAQPYAYASPWPRPDAAALGEPPRGGHWHTQDFVAAVATADELAPLGEPDLALAAFFPEAYGSVRATQLA